MTASAGFRPGPALRGTVRVPGSKSIAQRQLVCAALASGTTRISGLPQAEDVDAVRAVLVACGVALDASAPGALDLVGRPPGPHGGWRPARSPAGLQPEVDVGESGTGGRLLTAAIGLCAEPGRSVRVAARGTLLRRRSTALFDALARAGVGLEHEGPVGAWPVHVTPIGPPSEVALEQPRSSQEVSALLIALAAHPDRITLTVRGAIPSRPYVDLTLWVLESFGVHVEERSGDGVRSLFVDGPLRAPAGALAVEADASAAAVALAAACLSGGELTVPGIAVESKQGDAAIVEHLLAFGCRAERRREGLRAGGEPTRGAELDLSGEPDLAPVLAAVAAAVAARGLGTTRLCGLGTLELKESERLTVLAGALAGLGLRVSSGPDTLTVAPPDGPLARGPRELDPRQDHRMAFAFALLGLIHDGIEVADPGCVSKSWPGFWTALEDVGARRNRP